MAIQGTTRSRFRLAVWILPALLALIVLTALLVLFDGGSLSSFLYKSF